MDTKKIEKLCEIMKKHDLVEIEVEEDDKRVRLVKPTAGSSSVAASHSAAPVSVATPVVAKASTGSSAGTKVLSPFVGTYFEAPSPDAAPFVTVGQRIRKGDTLCIIEAMKIMNEIEAEQDCTVKEILVSNEDPVEFNQPLFIIE